MAVDLDDTIPPPEDDDDLTIEDRIKEIEKMMKSVVKMVKRIAIQTRITSFDAKQNRERIARLEQSMDETRSTLNEMTDKL